MFRNLIAALLKREPKDRPSLDSILRRGYIQKVSSWLTDGPPLSILPSTSKSARRRRGGPGLSISTRETEKATQDQISGQGPKQAKQDKKKEEQKTVLIRKVKPQSPVKVVRRQNSGKRRVNVELPAAQKEEDPSQREDRSQNLTFLRFKAAQSENEKFTDNRGGQNFRNPKNLGFSQEGGFEVDQGPSGIRGGQLMRTQENLKVVKWKFDGDQDHSGIRGGQLMRTLENPGVRDPSQSQSERDRQSDPTQVSLEHGVECDRDANDSLQRINFHRPWEMSSHVEEVRGFQSDHQGLYNSWWSNPTNAALYHEPPTKPARVTSSLGFTPANQMTDEELRQVLERPHSNPPPQARLPYESFSASHFPYSQLQAGVSLGWGQHSHGARNVLDISPQVVEGGNQEFYERQLAAQRFKERQRDDMFDRQEPRTAAKDLIEGSSVVQESVSKDGELDEQQYLEELKNIRVDHSRAKMELERRREREMEELDSWVDMSQDETEVLRRRGRPGIDEGTKVLRRSLQLEGEKTFTVSIERADMRGKENTYVLAGQDEEWWEKEDRRDFPGGKPGEDNQPAICDPSFNYNSQLGPDEELREDAWWEKEGKTPFEQNKSRKAKLSELKQKNVGEKENWWEDGERESPSGKRQMGNFKIGIRDKLDSQKQHFDENFDEEEEEEDEEEIAEEDVSQWKNVEIGKTSAEPGRRKLHPRLKTGIPIHDR